MSHCDALPKCAARKQSCQRPNPWNIFLMAHSAKSQTLENMPIVEKMAGIKAKSQVYRHLKEIGSPLCIDGNHQDVVSSDVVAMCVMYRQLKNIVFPPIVPTVPVVSIVPIVPIVTTIVPIVQAELTPLILAPGNNATNRWAKRLVDGNWPPTYNQVYGFVLCGHNFVVTPNDQMSTRSLMQMRSSGGQESWIDATIIDGFTTIVLQHCRSLLSTPSQVVRPSVIYACDLLGTHRSAAIQYLSLPRLKKQYLNARAAAGLRSSTALPHLSLFPFNLNQSHWILMAYDHIVKTWYSFDSYGGDHRGVAAKYHPYLLTMMDIHDVFRYTRLTVPRQNDFYQCGVWMCMYAMCALTGTRLPDVATSHPSAFSELARLYIAKTMHTNTVNLIIDPTIDLSTVDWH